jgi:predicted esterase
MNSLIHESMPVISTGAPLAQARAAMILLHGRGATAEDILTLSFDFAVPDIAYFAPQAADYAWYPARFIEPIQRNQPHLDSALATVDALIKQIQATSTLGLAQIIIGGFSQGACLALEYAARNPARYGAVLAFSGGLIGETLEAQRYPADGFAGTPIFVGCSDIDPHIPLDRVQASAKHLSGMGAQVTERIYPRMGHTINADEIAAAQHLLRTARAE